MFFPAKSGIFRFFETNLTFKSCGLKLKEVKGVFMGPSFWQILIVVVIVLFVFGPKRIPGLGKSLGEAIRGFRKGIREEDKEDSKKEDIPSSDENKA